MFLNARNRHAHSPNHRPLLLLLTACSPGGVTDQETDVVSFETAEPEAPYEDLEPVFFDHVRVVDPHDCVEDASFDPVTSVASLELGCPAGEMDLGGEWKRGEGWSLMAERTWDAELISPSMEAEASLEMSIGLRAKASVKLYSVAGPSFWAEPYASARADAHCEGTDWRAGAGVRAGAGLNLRLFDLLGWDDSVDREWHRDLASGTIEAPIPVPGLDCD